MAANFHPLALSTMWLQNRFDHVQPFVSAGRNLGFDRFELSHVVTPAMLLGLAGDDGIASLHFPAPTIPHPTSGRSADALLSSPDEEARRWAVQRGRISLDVARSLGAQVIIVHLGKVEMGDGLDWVLRQRFLGGQAGSVTYERTRARLWDERERTKRPYLAAALRSLEELADHAARAGIRIGIESRYHVHEIPTMEECADILCRFPGDTVGYWHDTGHTQNLANLGFWKPSDWLDLAGDRLLGVHLHDCVGIRDHLIPGLGGIDFVTLASRLPANCLRVCEFDWYYEEDEIVAGANALRQAGI